MVPFLPVVTSIIIFFIYIFICTSKGHVIHYGLSPADVSMTHQHWQNLTDLGITLHRDSVNPLTFLPGLGSSPFEIEGDILPHVFPPNIVQGNRFNCYFLAYSTRVSIPVGGMGIIWAFPRSREREKRERETTLSYPFEETHLNNSTRYGCINYNI